jgi:hypothetical protein
MFLGGMVIFISLLQIVETGFKGAGGEVLDLGMLSDGIEGRSRSAWALFLLNAGFLILATVIGLQYSAILFSTLAPLPFLDNRRAWSWCLVTGGLMAAFVFGLFDELMNIIWPEPVIGHWIASLF